MEIIDLRNKPTAVSSAVGKVMAFLHQNNLNDFDNGSHPIDGDDFFVNIFSYTTADENNRIWEAHRDYIDVHYVLSGQEILQQAFLPDCETGEYEAETDYVPITVAPVRSRCIVSSHFLAIFYPEDAHQTGIAVDDKPIAIRKAVFKIRI